MKASAKLTVVMHVVGRGATGTETLIYAALLTLAASRRLCRALTQRLQLDPERVPFDRCARLSASIANDLHDLMLRRRERAHLMQRILR
jgi:hypothetical protein